MSDTSRSDPIGRGLTYSVPIDWILVERHRDPQRFPR